MSIFLKRTTVALLACFSATIAFSDSFALGSCVALSDDTLRLSCYDKASNYAPKSENEPAAATATSYNGNWSFSERTDTFTDKDTSSLYMASDYSGRRGDDAPESIIMRCDGEKSFDIYVVFDGYIGSANDRVPVRYRFDGQEAVSERWSESTDGTAAFLPGSYKEFKAGLFSGANFVFEVSDYNGSTSSAKFTNSIHPKLEFIKTGCE